MVDSRLFSPIPQYTLADAVTARLREAIVTGQLAQGEKLAETALAAQMGVSRSPVREALHRLQLEGLVHSQPNHGSYVWEPTEADVDEIISLRVMIESLAAEWASPNLTDKDFIQLEEIIERQQQLIEAGDFLKLIHEDKHFHEYICDGAGHSRLMDWWQQIMSQWEALTYLRIQHRPTHVVPTVLTDHRAILDALRKRDLDEVIMLHRTINQRVSEEMKEALRVQAASEMVAIT
jgi:DNA-binding GntR family transcriptional regulator